MVDTKRDALHAAGRRRSRRPRRVWRLPAARHSTSSAIERIPASGLSILHRSRVPGPRLIGNVATTVRLPGLDGPARCSPASRNHGGRTAPRRGRAALSGACSRATEPGDGRASEGVPPRPRRRATYPTAAAAQRTRGSADWLNRHRARARGAAAALEDELERAAHADARRVAASRRGPLIFGATAGLATIGPPRSGSLSVTSQPPTPRGRRRTRRRRPSSSATSPRPTTGRPSRRSRT
jgi:hypothetical protein